MRRKKAFLCFLANLALIFVNYFLLLSFSVGSLNYHSHLIALAPEKLIDLKPELSIGVAEGDENYVFGMIRRLDVDSKGNIYILDWKYRKVKIFDQKGTYLREIVIPAGQGPQEADNLSGIAVTPSGILVINGQWKMILYNSQGEYLRTFKTDFSIFNIGCPGIEGVVGISPNKGKILHRFNLEGHLLESFGEYFPVPKEFESMKEAPMFATPLNFSCSKEGRLFLLNPHRYEIHIFKDGKLEEVLQGKNELFKPVRRLGRGFVATAASVFPVGKYYLVYLHQVEIEKYQADIFLGNKQVGSVDLPGELVASDSQGRLYFIDQREYPKIIRCSVLTTER